MSTCSVFGADGRRILKSVSDSYAREFASDLSNRTGEEISIVPDAPPAGLADIDTGQTGPTREQLIKLTRKKLDKAAVDAGVEEPGKLKSKAAVADAILAQTGDTPAADAAELVAFYAQWDTTDETELLTKIEAWDAETGPSEADIAAIRAHEEQHLAREAVLEALTP